MMAKATATKPRKSKTTKGGGGSTNGAPPQAKPKIDLPVEFGGVSIGDATCRIGVRVPRELLDLDLADEYLCGRRLTGAVASGGGGDAPGQQVMWDDLHHRITGTFDSKRFGVSPKHVTFGIAFNLADIAVKELGYFAKRAGRLVVYDVGPIEDSAAGEGEGGGQGDTDDGLDF